MDKNNSDKVLNLGEMKAMDLSKIKEDDKDIKPNIDLKNSELSEEEKNKLLQFLNDETPKGYTILLERDGEQIKIPLILDNFEISKDGMITCKIKEE
jgi:hypothetical protein